jgi:hypothetical protein
MILSVTKYGESTANFAFRLNKPKFATTQPHPIDPVGVLPGADGSHRLLKSVHPSYQTEVKIEHPHSASALIYMPHP